MKKAETINGRPVGISDQAWEKIHEIIARVEIRLAKGGLPYAPSSGTESRRKTERLLLMQIKGG